MSIRRLRWAALLLTLVAVFVVTVGAGARTPPAVTAGGPVTWRFHGSAAVVDRYSPVSTAAFRTAAAAYVGAERGRGRPFAQVGAPHALFATEYQPTWVDVVVLVAPVRGDAAVTSLVGIYASVGDQHGIADLVPAGADSQLVRSFVPATRSSGRLAVVVAGPGPGGLSVDFKGSTVRPEQVPGGESVTDAAGTAWLYPAVTD